MSDYTGGQMDMLRRLDMLRRRKAQSPATMGNVEELYATYASLQPTTTFDVVEPAVFTLKGAKQANYEKARTALGIQTDDLTAAIDLLGVPTAQTTPGTTTPPIILVSAEQGLSGIRFAEHAHLIPLMQALYKECGPTIRELTIREPLIGRINLTQNGKPVSDLGGYSLAGPYTLSVSVDTPTKSVKRLAAFQDRLNKYVAGEYSILDPEATSDITESANALRAELGALGRYSANPKQSASVTVNSVITTTEHGTQYHFATPKRNIIVYNGEQPYEGLEDATNFTLVSLSDKKEALHTLVRAGIYEPSEAILEARIAQLHSIAASAKEQGNTEAAERFTATADTFTSHRESLGRLPKTVARAEWACTIEPGTLEYFLVPKTTEPTAHVLLPRLYQRQGLELYHNTSDFIKAFDGADETGRTSLLTTATSQIFFSHEQNLDVNAWLYHNHRELCEKSGVRFNEKKEF